jgi:CheY-like chemotaxis protein
MGGHLRAASEFGKGSVFTVDLPTGRTSTGVSTQQAAAGRRVLLVEDSEDNQLLVAAYLKSSVYRMEIASNGRDGISKFTSGNFDLVLMDIQMPEMDGWTATAKMREWEAKHNKRPVPILALTANVTPNDFHLSRVAGCNAHLTKPITQDRLLHALDEHLAASADVRVGLPPAVEELGPKYLRNRRADLETLNAALNKCDYNSIRVLGHNMKGSGGGYGFPRISEIGKRLELAAKSESGREIETEMTALSDYLNLLLIPTE